MKVRGAALGIGLLGLFLSGWQWGPGLLGVPSFIIPPLSAVLKEMVRMVALDHLFYHMGATAAAVVAGFAIGSLVGMITGYLLGMSPTLEIAISPYILGLQLAPKVAFAPLFIMWFGYNSAPKIVVAVLIVFFPVMVNVLGAMRTIDQDIRNLARSFSASRSQLFWKVEFPASLPALFSGLRVGATLSVIGVVVGEMVGGNSGIGYLLVFGEGQANTPMVFVSILVLTGIGIVAYLAVVMAERWQLRWLPQRATN